MLKRLIVTAPIVLALLYSGLSHASYWNETPFQDRMLKCLSANTIPVEIFLINGVKLEGTITKFNDTHLLLNGANQRLILSQSIAFINPTQSDCDQ